MPARKQVTKKGTTIRNFKLAHLYLAPGLEHLMDEGRAVALESLDDMHQHPTYQLVLHEMLEKKVPA